MARTVFILGAGASKEAGGPLMLDFLDVANRLYRQGRVGDAAEHFELVLHARDSLQAVQAKAYIDVFNMENVFGLFEMGRILGTLGSLETKHIDKLPTAMRIVVATTLQQSVVFRPGDGGTVLPPYPYAMFAGLVADVRESQGGGVSVISFNYDLAADYAFHYASMPIDYALTDDPAKPDAMAFCKLHGSVNWASCAKCEMVQPLTLDAHFARRVWAPLRRGEDSHRLSMSQHLTALQHCSKPSMPEPVIVPPTWNKGRYHGAIESVWRRAAKELSEAETLVVIGYSLPPTDQFFQYLFGLGCVGRHTLRHVIVCNPDGAVADRFRALLAPAVVHGGFTHMGGVFSDCLGPLRQRLVRPAPA